MIVSLHTQTHFGSVYLTTVKMKVTQCLMQKDGTEISFVERQRVPGIIQGHVYNKCQTQQAEQRILGLHTQGSIWECLF